MHAGAYRYFRHACVPCETRLVNDLLEVNGDLCTLAVAVVGGVVDELGDLVEPQLWKDGWHAKRAFSMGWQAPAFLRRQRTCFALLPKTKSIASMTFDLPLPFGPTTAENDCGQGSCQNNAKRVRCKCPVYYFMEGPDVLNSSI